VQVRVLPYGRGSRLEVMSERRNRSVFLDATIMEALTALTGEELVQIVALAVGDEPVPGGSDLPAGAPLSPDEGEGGSSSP
jgi:hypothetical protein